MGFIEIEHEIDLDATYFKLHLTIIKFSTLFPVDGVVILLLSRTTFLEAFISAAGVAALKLKGNFFLLRHLCPVRHLT